MKKWIFAVLFASSWVQASDENLILATGFGTADLNAVKVLSQGKLMARRAAIVDAQRNLAEQIRGVRLTGGTTMDEYEISSDIVATRVKGLLKGAFEYDQKVLSDDQSITVEVTMAICLNNKPEQCKNRDSLVKLEQELLNDSKNK